MSDNNTRFFLNGSVRTVVAALSCYCILINLCSLHFTWWNLLMGMDGQSFINRNFYVFEASQQHDTREKSVGTFNGHSVYIVEDEPQTSFHCVGDTYQDQSSWFFRSCEVEHFCFDMNTFEFVIYDDSFSEDLPPGWHSNSLRKGDPETGMGVNGIPLGGAFASSKDFSRDIMFHPKILSSSAKPSSFYLLDVTMIPFWRHHIGYRNPGHHLWQDLVPIFSLIDMFDKQDSQIFLAPLKRKVSADKLREGDADLMNRWGSQLMGMPTMSQYNHFLEDGDFEFDLYGSEYRHEHGQNDAQASDSNPPQIICAKSALMGMGELGYHEIHHHNGTHSRENNRAELSRDLVPAHHGKGGFFRRMRAYFMKNMGIEEHRAKDSSTAQLPKKILFSLSSSTRGARGKANFTTYMDHLESTLPTNEVSVEGLVLATMSLKDQIITMADTDIFVSATGGGTASALFLPPGAHLILFYSEWFLDWDYWNNISHLTVHWIPIHVLQDSTGLPAFQQLIERSIRI